MTIILEHLSPSATTTSEGAEKDSSDGESGESFTKYTETGMVTANLVDTIKCKVDANLDSMQARLVTSQVDAVKSNYNMGLITNNERYNQIIDVWTSTNSHLTSLAMKKISERLVKLANKVGQLY